MFSASAELIIPTIILGLFDHLPNFPSPQVKRSAIITYKHGIYELPNQLPNDLRL